MVNHAASMMHGTENPFTIHGTQYSGWWTNKMQIIVDAFDQLQLATTNTHTHNV